MITMMTCFKPRTARKVFCFLSAACVSLASVQESDAGNLLSNPGFEADPAGQSKTLPGWSSFGENALGETSPSTAHSGINHLKVCQACNGMTNYTGIYQDYISGAGAVYSADGWTCTPGGDKLAGRNIAWIEVSFRGAKGDMLALYRSALVTTNSLANGTFPANAWFDLPVTNQCDLSASTVTNTTQLLIAPAGTYFVRYQVMLQGDADASAKGCVYFDDLNLVQSGGLPYGDWNMVWSDEFNGANIDPQIWTLETGNGRGGWGNHELEYYTGRTNNAYVADGLLHIVARQESTNGFNYTSARLKSQGLFSCRYGRFEWRAKFPGGAGFWPAIWLLGTNLTTLGWPRCGEIDVVENKGSHPGTVQASLHSGSDETGSYHFMDGGSVTNFHVYTLDWSTNAFLFYVDGHLYETQTGWTSSFGSYPFPFNQPFFLIMNLAVGGNYLANSNGNPSIPYINANSTFPDEMQVDYVRIYNQRGPQQVYVPLTNSSASVF